MSSGRAPVVTPKLVVAARVGIRYPEGQPYWQATWDSMEDAIAAAKVTAAWLHEHYREDIDRNNTAVLIERVEVNGLGQFEMGLNPRDIIWMAGNPLIVFADEFAQLDAGGQP